MTENENKKHASKCSFLLGKDCDCDGYHTFGELYDHRIALWIAFCKFFGGVWRTKTHSDGSKIEDWFVLGLGQKSGFQITYHLPMKEWDRCGFAETLDKAPEWDGHTSDDVLERLKRL